MEKLKQCPFCGSFTGPDYGTLYLDYLHPDVVTGYWVECFKNKSGCGAATGDGDTKQIAAALWNKRV